MCNNLCNNNQALVVDPPYPGTPLRVGSSGSEVARMQKYLNTIRAMKYPGLNPLTVDGKYGNATKTTVMQFQGYALLSIDGVIGLTTWNAIVSDYNSLVGGSANTYPGIPLRQGMTGQDVSHMERLLNAIALIYTAINTETVDGVFGTNMYNAVRRFQLQFSLTTDGVIGPATWNKIVEVYNASLTSNRTHVTTPYPGYALSVGASGDSVRCIQSYLNASSQGRWPRLTIDGQFGNGTKNAVIAFQATYGLTPDGVVGSMTWAQLVLQFNNSL